jgi:DNA-binding NarL/FixJ family response regulator
LATPVRVLIADDEQRFSNALELILGADDRIRVVGRALDGRQAVALARELDPDVVVIDLSMPGVTGFQEVREMVEDDAAAAWWCSAARLIPTISSAPEPRAPAAT